VSVAAFIGSQRTEHGVPHAVACRALGISESWFYKWRDRPATARLVRRAELAAKIREFFDASGGTYGSPRITLDLWAAGYRVSENTVAKLMAELGLAGRKPRRRPKHLTKPGKRPAAPDLVRRKFTAVAPNVLWCGDLTEIDTDEGKLYLATVLDLFSRRLLGYAMSEHHDAVLARASLQMAVAARGDVDGVIFHSDRGSEYSAELYAKACRKLGVIQSMGRVGSALDNAAAEAFNSIIKVEYIHRHRFRTRAEARLKISTWIVDFYNTRRRHSACDGMSPIDYERLMAEARRPEAA
jgi:transposase InsO family protein